MTKLEESLQTMKERINTLENIDLTTSGRTDEFVLTALALKALAAHKVVNKVKKGYNNLANRTNQQTPA